MPSINTNPNYIVCDMVGIALRLRSKPQVIQPLTADEEAIKNLTQEINDRQEDLVQLRRAVAQSMAVFNRQEKKYAESASQAEEWEKRALLALQMGDKKLAGEVLSHKKTCGKRLITCFITTKPEIIGKNTVSSAEMSMDEVKSRFAKLEADNSKSDISVDAELAALKAKIMADSLADQIVLPPTDTAK